MNGDRISECLARSPRLILDAGCGPHGSMWWSSVRPETRVVAIDLYNRPAVLPANFEFLEMDVVAAGAREEWRGRFDLIVADHLLEHLPDPPAAASVLAQLLAPTGELHIGFPDASMFTDRFYRLIHPEGGGHIAKLSRDSVIGFMAEAGLEPVLVEPWEDSWTWLTGAYDLEGRGIRFLSREELEYIADVFRRELTAEKGYLYGWEMVLRHAATTPAASVATSVRRHPRRVGRWRHRWRRFVSEYVCGSAEQRSRVGRDLGRLVRRALGGGKAAGRR